MKLNLFLATLLFILLQVTSLTADVIDPVPFFSKEAVEKANTKIQEIKSKTGKEFVLETIDSTNSTNPSDFALDRAKSLKVNGVYVLISKKEKKIEIKVGNKTKSVFTDSDISALKGKLVEAFKTQNFDSGLDNAVTYYSSVLLSAANSKPSKRTAENSPPASSAVPSSNSGGGFSILSIVLIGVVLFILFRVISGMMGGGLNPGMGGMGGGGMGFFGSLMTGMLGAVAGNWLYDKFMGNDSLSANDSSSYSDSSSGDWSSQDDSYSSDSGSFDSGDSDMGGGDW